MQFFHSNFGADHIIINLQCGLTVAGGHIIWEYQLVLVLKDRVLFGCISAGLVAALNIGTAVAESDILPNTGVTKVTVEALYLGRDDIDGTSFTGPDTPGGDFILFKPSELNPDWSTGFRATVDTIIMGRDIQFSGFYAGPFETSKTITGADAGSLRTNATYDDDAHLNPGSDVGSTANSDELFALAIDHETTLYGGEINLVEPADFLGLPGHAFLFGVRGLYLGEDLKSIAYDELDDFQGTDDDIDRVRIEAKNRLLGAQIGLQAMQPITENIYIGGNVKAGLFANFVKVDRSFSRDDNVNDVLNDSNSGTGFAQVLEINPQVKVKFAENAYLSLGGNATWVNGISEAGDQYATVTDADDRNLRNDGSMLFYGATAALVFKFN